MDADGTMKARAGEPRAGATRFTLKIIGGKDAGRALELDGASGPVLLGTSEAAALRLTDPLVSRRHLALDVTGAFLRLTDAGSSNGTTINGVRVVDALLSGGETITIGGTTIVASATVEAAPPRLSTATNFGRMIGASVAMRRLYPTCARLAASTLPVVIEGETGTGKELLAETLHELGPRSGGAFVVFDCASVGSDRTEVVLFGEEAGAVRRPGIIAQADGGTLFLDEIGELDVSAQGKLLRVIERGEYIPVGATVARKADVRFIAASRRDLDHAVQSARLREDLYYRLSVGRLDLPPLRHRAGDVALLAGYFWKKMLDSDDPLPRVFLAQLESYSWPGNVRELMNAIGRRIAIGEIGEGETIDSVRGSRGSTPGEVVERVLELDVTLPQARTIVIEDFERRYVERILEKHGGNVTRAAAASGLARRYFQVLRARQRTEGEGGEH